MGSRFLRKTVTSTGKSGAFRAPEKPILAWFQFVPASVIDVVVNAYSPHYESDRDLNAVIVKVHYEDAFGTDIDTAAFSTEKYYPLFSNALLMPPIRGEQVLVCTFGGVNYYIGPVNTVNLPNFNPDTLKRQHPNLIERNSVSNESLFGISKQFKMEPRSRLSKLSNGTLDGVSEKTPGDIHGDMLLEGRHGNSIRIGSRSANPYIFLSNGRDPSTTTEGLFDKSFIGMTNVGSIYQHYPDLLVNIDGSPQKVKYVLPSDRDTNNNRPISGELYNYNYTGDHIIQSSDKITIASNSQGIYLSSFDNVVIGAGNSLQIYSNSETIIESSNIYLGKQAREQNEPIVLGTKLTEILEEIVSILESMKVTGTIGGMSGPPAPDVLAKITNLRTTLQSVAHLSEYHFIEDNGQKAD